MKKIERLDYNTSVYPPHIPRLQTVIEKVQELIDAHNELAKIVGLLLKRDEENCLEKAKAELLETHTVKEEIWDCNYCGTKNIPKETGRCNCILENDEEPTTPEKKCTDLMHMGMGESFCCPSPKHHQEKLPTSSYKVTCGGNEKIRKCDCGGPPKTNHSAACAIFR